MIPGRILAALHIYEIWNRVGPPDVAMMTSTGTSTGDNSGDNPSVALDLESTDELKG